MSGHQIDPRFGVPIIGSAPAQIPNAPGLTINCEVHDSEINQIHKVVEIMRERAERHVEYAAFDREYRERLNEIGFVVAINWYTTNVDGVLIPEITIRDRTERKAFDHDQQVHEVTSDLLGLGEGGVIKSEPFVKPKHEH